MIDLQNTHQPPKYKVLLIGDSCIDEYRIGNVERLSPEAPVPIIKITTIKKVPGMAQNVKKNLENLNIFVDFITNNEAILKTRYIDSRSNQHMLRVDLEPTITPWSGILPQNINNYDAIVISDYNKGFVLYEHIEDIIKSFKGPIFIDTKKQNLSEFGSKNVFVKINEYEFKQLQSYSGNLIVTLGERGAMLGHKEFPTKKVDVVDVCGCGDTFLAALTYQYLKTKSIEKAIIFANSAATITVQHTGNYAPTLKEIENGY